MQLSLWEAWRNQILRFPSPENNRERQQTQNQDIIFQTFVGAFIPGGSKQKQSIRHIEIIALSKNQAYSFICLMNKELCRVCGKDQHSSSTSCNTHLRSLVPGGMQLGEETDAEATLARSKAEPKQRFELVHSSTAATSQPGSAQPSLPSSMGVCPELLIPSLFVSSFPTGYRTREMLEKHYSFHSQTASVAKNRLGEK